MNDTQSLAGPGGTGEADSLAAAPVRWRKRPVTIEAVQWTGGNLDEVYELADPDCFDVLSEQDRLNCGDPEATATVFDKLHMTWVLVKTGQWIIKGIRGEFYPCADDVFRETYEPAATEAPLAHDREFAAEAASPDEVARPGGMSDDGRAMTPAELADYWDADAAFAGEKLAARLHACAAQLRGALAAQAAASGPRSASRLRRLAVQQEDAGAVMPGRLFWEARRAALPHVAAPDWEALDGWERDACEAGARAVLEKCAPSPQCDARRWHAVVTHGGAFAWGFAATQDGLRVYADESHFESARARDFE